MLARVNFIGCGRLGKTLGKLLKVSGQATIQGIVSSSIKSASEAVKFIGGGRACEKIEDLPQADIYIIATRDDLIQNVSSQLSQANILKSKNIVLHCSGSLSSDILESVKKHNCLIASIHPIKSFANSEEAVQSFSGTFCAVEGDAEAISVITTLFEKMGGNVFEINKEKKSLYHSAGVIANNYLVTLHYYAVQSYIASGVDEKIAKKIVSMLMNDALNNLKDLPHTAALTGPIQRGDTQTVVKHMAAYNNNSIVKNIYSFLGQGTLAITKHSDHIKEEFKDIFNKKTDEQNKSYSGFSASAALKSKL